MEEGFGACGCVTATTSVARASGDRLVDGSRRTDEVGPVLSPADLVLDRPNGDPDEAWTWLQRYRIGTNKAQNEEPGPSCLRGKNRLTRGLMGDTQVTKPTQQQTSQGKKVALQAAASLL
ncbi:hypothetical protein NDU88_002950 [Pleurodeles waltl]|uniref:Uncharacterized protein n=1 Tax=Pleurodeles waltl TaxID=8319 RepID=A0AAV7T3K8_PLEWA|nr:hypothetical protein NDU88_002950 [Pleurodeles waltl]